MAGYDYSKGMSNNAVGAYNEGLVPKSKIRKEDLKKHGINISVRFAYWLIENGYWLPQEWHHSSKAYNEVNFYSYDDLKDFINDEETDLEDLREKFKQAAASDARGQRVKGTYALFGGTLKRPKFIEDVEFTGTLRGKIIITDAGHEKRASGNHITWEYIDEQKAS